MIEINVSSILGAVGLFVMKEIGSAIANYLKSRNKKMDDHELRVAKLEKDVNALHAKLRNIVTSAPDVLN